MVSPRLLVVQPDELDPPARLADWLTGAGAELDVVRPDKNELADPTAYQGVVCLGGAMGANDDLAHPWLADVRRLLAASVTARVPTLAICLGAQLLTVATGGQVEVGDEGPEVGPGLVAKRDAAWKDPLFADLPFTPDVLQFHYDAIVRLPPSTELLAAATRYPNQAFRVGPTAYGVQFHIETTTEIVLEWARLSPDSAGHARPGDLDPERLETLHHDLEETWRPFAERFVRLAAGELRPVAATLPIA